MYLKSQKSVSEICPVSEHAFKYFSDVKSTRTKSWMTLIKANVIQFMNEQKN